MRIVIVGCGTSGHQIIPSLKNTEVIDRDIVEEKNLSRQTLFSRDDVGKPKALVIGQKYNVPFYLLDLDHTNINILRGADVVIDCTDNLATRFLINEFCHKNNIPWLYTGMVGDRGRVLGFDGEYCFRCLFSEVKGLDTCTTTGINLEMAKEVGSIAVREVNNILSGNKPRGLWANGEWIHVNRNPSCAVCAGVEYPYLDGKQESVVKFCGSSRFQFKGNFDYDRVRQRLGGKGDWFVQDDFYVFKDRVLVKADDEKQAMKKFSEVIGL